DLQVAGSRAQLHATQALGEAGVGSVHVQEDDAASLVAHSVPNSGRSGVERAGGPLNDLLSDDQFGLAVEHEERVDLVVVLVDADSGPRRVDGQVERGDLRPLAL